MDGRLAALCLRHQVFGKWQVAGRGRDVARGRFRVGGRPRGVRQQPLVKLGLGKYSGRN